MPSKMIGYDKVVATKTKGQPRGKVLVKLRRDKQAPRWEQMSLEDYRRRSIIRR
jgi:hypothetical protein